MIYKVGDTISYFEIRFNEKLEVIKEGYKIAKEKSFLQGKGQLLILDKPDDYSIITSVEKDLSPYHVLNKPFVMGRIRNDKIVSFIYTDKPIEATRVLINEIIEYCFNFGYKEYAKQILELSKEL